MNPDENIIWERKDAIGILSLSNGKENYLENPDFVNLKQLKNWTLERGLKGIIVKGLGRNFSAGANIEKLNVLSKNSELLAKKMHDGKTILDFIEDLNIPVIAAINGVCFGGGLEIALACHIRVASERALFAFPETNHGLIPGLSGSYRLTQLIGKKAFEFILSADMVCAAEAKKLGVIDGISETKDAYDLALEKMNSMIADRPIEVIHAAMKAIRNSRIMPREEALKHETDLFCNLAVNVNFHQKE